MSVEKNGAPMPAPKITMRPFSRWRTARRGMYGSAIWVIWMAVWTLVTTSRRSRASWRARQFMTVPSMPM